MRYIQLIFILLIINSSLFAKANLYIFVFKDGVAFKDTKIQVGEHISTTNEYGYTKFELQSDTYEISYFKDGKLFALSEANIVDDQDSQVFLTITKDKAEVELDLPLEAYDQDFKKVDIKKLEGPKGTIELKLTDSKTKKPISKAKLYFKGYAIEGLSDENGIAKIDIPKGKFDISIVHPNYVMKVLKDITVEVKKTTSLTQELVKSDIALEEYVVLAPAVEGSLASTFAELKDSDVMGDALSAEQFSKSGDSSAAGALKRVTGITIVGGKYVYVRGLGERYSTILLNGLHIPSPEPTKRVVPLDIFPTGVIQSMNIQKSYSTDLPGTFAGGSVLIKTKDIPKEDNYVKGSISLSYDADTGKNVYYNSSNSNPLPSDLIAKSSNFNELTQELSIGDTVIVEGYTQEEILELRKSMATYRNYNLTTKKIEPGKKISLSTGQSYKTSSGLKYGFAGSIYYQTDADIKNATKYSTFYDIPNDKLTASEKSEYQTASFSEKYGGLVSFGVENDNNKLKYSLLSLEENSDSTVYSEKDGGQEGPGIDDSKKYYFEYKEKTILAHQFNGEHTFEFGKSKDKVFDDLKLTWGYETAKATRLEPGTVEYAYEKNSDVTDYALDKDIWYMYSDLTDEVDNYRLDFTLPYENNKQNNYIQFGYFNYKKTRSLDNRRFRVRHDLGTELYDLVDDAITEQNAIDENYALTVNYKPADAYIAEQDVDALYIKNLYSITNNLDILVGARQETSNQVLIETKTNEAYDPLKTDDMLPNLGFTYRLNDTNQIRASYAKSISRPDFREFSPNRYKDPITDDIVFGYPYLKSTTITNYDLKYEWYPSFDESISFAVFKKDFTNPIETVTAIDDTSQEGNSIVSYRNAVSATSIGFELGVRNNLNFIDEDLKNYFIALNYAKIKSEIKLDKTQVEPDGIQPIMQNLTTSSRPMQGQSPYVTNIQMGYDNFFTGRSAILLYNEYGKRINSLGSYSSPDYYEQPYKKLDFVVKYRINDTYDLNEKKIGYTLSFKAENLLDSSVEITQGDITVESYKPGQSFNLSLAIKY